jgi:hypothetical protein
MVNQMVQEVRMISNTSVFTIDPEAASGQSPTEHSYKEINPVELTDDILKQYGFIYHDHFQYWQLKNAGIRSEMDINRNYEVINFLGKPIIKRLASLHQLQNAYFAMKGRELMELPLTSLA